MFQSIAPVVTSVEDVPASQFSEDLEAVELPSKPLLTIPIEDLETIELTSTTFATTPASISTDDIDTAKFPAMAALATASQDSAIVMLPPIAPVRISLVDFIRRKYDKILFTMMVVMVTLVVGWISYALPGTLLVVAALFIGTVVVFM